jgi:hypothetical protein
MISLKRSGHRATLETHITPSDMTSLKDSHIPRSRHRATLETFKEKV